MPTRKGPFPTSQFHHSRFSSPGRWKGKSFWNFFFFVCEREELGSGTAEATGMENLKDPPRRPGRKELSDWQRWRFPLRVWTGS